ncbi:riboflavin synthase subunit alpha [Candidatus Kaiserbacteria bacterium RIFCSPHIGHO2_02_FULL_59_21]|uniref:Riboflavin synthase n=1 Tax=Candidatus Kaiserbacteria bacterium RIFCSPHIGHO2_02_FULL_59_21 TaxID=1798500 RepID=A0A1F6E183_9BACT|nr:MAG: riboflavin synthase subunit alpha [Candidatus Kaiserbacteria bacterium RIFCSPHIGHO2_01_FULL_58_22]OGG67455.1 MAG: riboflavin synthase subunit alpha [Candidatus Kaiserbacteria bacterium RIFCSPHIGHO2_02_FULL_59_21]OGG87052.1 MAG: riboflavin synthase subunit alpha [Candidatus Kaiserbacteria bacterium RIFCSPLOWO2_02_FULL_59_19]
MFSGIISHIGSVAESRGGRLAISAPRNFVGKLGIGTSVAVNGACLTVVGKKGGAFVADIMPETARRTTLGRLRKNAIVNLELPATPDSFLSGHIVQGHIDGIGALTNVARKGNGRMLKFSLPRGLSKYVVEKGSIAVNGVSLTVIQAGKNCFTGVIPHTWRTTSMHALKPGDPVNIEVDIIAKYLKKLLKTRA